MRRSSGEKQPRTHDVVGNRPPLGTRLHRARSRDAVQTSGEGRSSGHAAWLGRLVLCAALLVSAWAVSTTTAGAATPQGVLIKSTPRTKVYRESNGDYRIYAYQKSQAKMESGVSPESQKSNEEEPDSGCTLWSNEPTTNECLNINSPELIGFGKPPANAVGRGKEETPTGTFHYLQWYEFSEEELPVGSHVVEATDSEYINSSTNAKHPIPVGLYGVVNEWNMGTTWDNASGSKAWWSPGSDYNLSSAVVVNEVGAKKGWVSWNIDSLVQEWANRGVIAPGRSDDGFVMADAESQTTVENVLSIDNKPEQEGYIEMLAEPDKTPPTKPQNFDAMFNAETGQSTITWEASSDPPFPDGYRGSGVASYSYRYKLGSGAWSSWTSTPSPAFVIGSTTNGEQISIEVDAIDNAKNVGPIATTTLTTTGPTLTPENPGGTLAEESGEVYMVPEPLEYENFAMNAMMGRGPTEKSPTDSGVKPDTAYSEKLCPTNEPCGKYDAPAAAAYAERWSLQGPGKITNGELRVEEENAQHDYNFGFFGGGEGGDCTNFASAALHAGGMQYMRSHGDSNPDGNAEYTKKAADEEFLKGEGSWWSYFTDYPYGGTNIRQRSYEVTESFVRAYKLYPHLLEYGLARTVKNGEYVRPGDIVFYDLEGPSLEAKYLDHAQTVIKTSHKTVIVAQHSAGYEHSLGYIFAKLDKEKGAEHQKWDFTIIEPIHTAANIVG